MSDVPEQHRPQRGELIRLSADGYRLRGGAPCTLLVTHRADGSWAIHGLAAEGDVGVGMSGDEMVTLAESILDRAYQ